jgi:hypothetical protein
MVVSTMGAHHDATEGEQGFTEGEQGFEVGGRVERTGEDEPEGL